MVAGRTMPYRTCWVIIWRCSLVISRSLRPFLVADRCRIAPRGVRQNHRRGGVLIAGKGVFPYPGDSLPAAQAAPGLAPLGRVGGVLAGAALHLQPLGVGGLERRLGHLVAAGVGLDDRGLRALHVVAVL